VWWFSVLGFGLAPHDQVQSNPAWHSLVRCFSHEFKMTSHIYTPNLREINIVLHWSKYSIISWAVFPGDTSSTPIFGPDIPKIKWPFQNKFVWSVKISHIPHNLVSLQFGILKVFASAFIYDCLAERKIVFVYFLSDIHSQCDRWTVCYSKPLPTCFFKSKCGNIMPHCLNLTGTTQVLHVKTSYQVTQA